MEVDIHVLLRLARPAAPAVKAGNPSGLTAFLNRVELSCSQSDTSLHVHTAFPNLFTVLRKKSLSSVYLSSHLIPSPSYKEYFELVAQLIS